MSYQEERLQEIADAIREVKGTTEKIPATNFASEIVGLSVVKPSGIKTITENGDYDVSNYAWASVKVEADLNERVIIGKWGVYISIDDSWVLEFLLDKTFKLNTGTTIITGSYVISGTQIIMSVDSETMTVQYNNENDTIDMDGDVLLRMPTVSATLITKEVTENGTYKASDDGADGYSEVVVNVASSGGKPSPFADATPEEIQQIGNEISAKGMTSAEVEETYGWKIGDTKDITLTTGEVIQMRIIGFNHDNLTGGGKAGITLEMVNCLSILYKMKNTDTNAGGWGKSVMRTQTLPTIKATLPQGWQDIIVKVDKKSANGGRSNFSAVVTTSDDLFVLSEVEMWSKQFAQDGNSRLAQNGTEEGSLYEYWVGKQKSDLAKYYDSDGDGVPETQIGWWLRSCLATDTKSFLIAHKNGFVYQATATANWATISFAFCVGSSPAPVIAGLPIEITTDTDMTNALVEDNLGKVYKFTGTSDTYDNNAIYIIEEI